MITFKYMSSIIAKTTQTAYPSHDLAYQRNKAAGLPGWDDAEGLVESISLLTRVFSHADIPKEGRVLDVGCGAGNISFWLEKRGYDVVGIDVSRVAIDWAIEEAKLRKSKLSFAVFDAAKDRYIASEPFDIVLDNHALHCIIGQDRQKYLSNIINNLKAGGIYICNTMCNAPKDPEVLKNFDATANCYIRNDVAIRYIGRQDDIIREIEAAGFRILQADLMLDEVQDSLSIIAQKVMNNT